MGANLVAALDLAGTGLSAVDFAGGVHVIEATLSVLLGLLGVVRVGDGSLCG